MAKKVIAVPDEFASAMQQLSIEAEKTLPPGLITMVTETYDEPVSETAETGDLNERLDALEKKLFDKIDNLAAQLS